MHKPCSYSIVKFIIFFLVKGACPSKQSPGSCKDTCLVSNECSGDKICCNGCCVTPDKGKASHIEEDKIGVRNQHTIRSLLLSVLICFSKMYTINVHSNNTLGFRITSNTLHFQFLSSAVILSYVLTHFSSWKNYLHINFK